MPSVPAGVVISYADDFDLPLIHRNVPLVALMESFFTEFESSKTNLSMTTEEFHPTANFVPSRNRNSPSPVLEVLIRSSR